MCVTYGIILLLYAQRKTARTFLTSGL